jgi:hypothetical protein
MTSGALKRLLLCEREFEYPSAAVHCQCRPAKTQRGLHQGPALWGVDLCGLKQKGMINDIETHKLV